MLWSMSATGLTVTCTLDPHGPATAIVFDDDQVRAVLGEARVGPVVVTIRDRRARLRLARMGGLSLIGISKAARAELGVEIGDEVTALIERDAEELTVEPPAELAEALDRDPAAAVAFTALSFTRRREMAESVGGAKRPEARARRLEAALAALTGTVARG